MIHNDSIIRIMQHTNEKQRYKIVMEFQESVAPCEFIFKALCGPDFMTMYNENI